MHRFIIVLICCLLLCVGGARAAVQADDVAWISGLPGIGLLSSHAGEHTVTNTYHTPAAAETFTMLLAELPRHGWHIQKATDVEDLRASVRMLTATRGSEQINVSLQNSVDVGGQMSLSLMDTHVAGDTTTHMASTGHTAILNGNRHNVTIHLENAPYLVNGHGNHVTVIGACSELTVNGGGNKITVQGPVRRIQLNGHHNEVDWSAAANPAPPEINQTGQDNRVIEGP
jgi:hypothetical protein